LFWGLACFISVLGLGLGLLYIRAGAWLLCFRFGAWSCLGFENTVGATAKEKKTK
jgi:hypothetical protein